MLAAQLAQVDAAIAEGEAALQTARSDFSRGAERLRGGSIATQVVEQRQSAARQAKARLMLAPARARRSQSGWPRRGSSHPPMAWSFAARCSLAPSRRRARRCSRLVRDGPASSWSTGGAPSSTFAAVPPRPDRARGAWRGCRRPCAPLRRWSRRTRVSRRWPYRAAAESCAPMFARADILLDAATVLVVPQTTIVFREDAGAARRAERRSAASRCDGWGPPARAAMVSSR